MFLRNYYNAIARATPPITKGEVPLSISPSQTKGRATNKLSQPSQPKKPSKVVTLTPSGNTKIERRDLRQVRIIAITNKNTKIDNIVDCCP